MPKVNNLIFDLGQVLLPVDFHRPVNAFNNLGLENFDDFYQEAVQSDLFNKLETSQISENDFRDAMREISGRNMSDKQIDDAWNTMILDFREKTINMLRQLKSSYRLFLLSNTNSIHYKVYNQQIIDRYDKAGLNSFFEKAFYSFEMGLRKPDPEIFMQLLKETDIKAEETLFVDDNKDNIETAGKLGFKTIHLNHGRKIEELFGEDLQ